MPVLPRAAHGGALERINPITERIRALLRKPDRPRAASRVAGALFLAVEFALEAGAQPGPALRWSLSGLLLIAALVELARDARAFRLRLFRHRWPDLLIALPGLALYAAGSPRAGAAFLLARLATRDLLDIAYTRPGRSALGVLLRRPISLLALSFALTIAAGTVALLPPAASAPGRQTGLLTALFTATSAACVTGLSVVDVGSHFSRFGHWVILILIQLGGLGIMTLTTALALVLRRQLSARAHSALQEIVEEETVTGFRRLVVSIVAMTLALEGIGALLLYPVLGVGPDGQSASPGDRAFLSAFHAVSAFCNAGFALFPDNLARFSGHPGFNAVIGSLIILGGLGFPVLAAVLRVDLWWQHGLRGGWARLPVHARVVLVTTGGLLAAGTLAFLTLEWSRSLAALSPGARLLASAFQSVTLRTAGFNTVDFTSVGTPMLLLCLVWMFVGGSPGGTAGGVKTTTVAVLALTFRAMLRNRPDVELYGRSVPVPTVYRAAAVAVISLGALVTLMFALVLVEPGRPFMDLLFEAVSAFGTVGLTLGVTPTLGAAGQLVVCALMFAGRLGPFTLALAAGLSKDPAEYSYPSTKIVVG